MQKQRRSSVVRYAKGDVGGFRSGLHQAIDERNKTHTHTPTYSPLPTSNSTAIWMCVCACRTCDEYPDDPLLTYLLKDENKLTLLEIQTQTSTNTYAHTQHVCAQRIVFEGPILRGYRDSAWKKRGQVKEAFVRE